MGGLTGDIVRVMNIAIANFSLLFWHEFMCSSHHTSYTQV